MSGKVDLHVFLDENSLKQLDKLCKGKKSRSQAIRELILEGSDTQRVLRNQKKILALLLAVAGKVGLSLDEVKNILKGASDE